MTAIKKLAATIKSIGKIILCSRCMGQREYTFHSKEIVVMGNGPSLRDVIDNHAEFLASHDLLAVNFAANTDDFRALRPKLYILADPHFFEGEATDSNVRDLWSNIARTDWKMALYVPARHVKALRKRMPANIRIVGFNMVGVDGFRKFRHRVYRLGLGMPRPRNVLIPAIMCAIDAGYGIIHIVGADHSWTKTLSVDDDNNVVSIQPHFYKDNDNEQQRVATVYKNVRLHDMLESMSIAFRSYFDIADYAASRSVKILNATEGSFIDAFKREKLD